ncbi:MAG: DUF3990 domain-containing protein [Bacteroidales bacterium]|jgi:hypothetical protein|nr:DUF3990 domain-containing protein [Bacteroidales bacterium]
MKVYHGSYKKIDKIDLTLCRPHTDFGQGFYVTKFRHHAVEKAEREGMYHKTEGYVTEFEFTDGEFTEWICNIKRFDSYTEEWLDFVAMNRDDSTRGEQHPYDIVEGPVADDKIQHRIKKYLKGEISKIDFLNQISHTEETHQICFCTINALQTLKSIDNVPDIDFYIEEIGEPLLEALIMEFGLSESEAADKFYLSNTFAQLTKIATGLYLKSWSEIYRMLKQELEIRK